MKFLSRFSTSQLPNNINKEEPEEAPTTQSLRKQIFPSGKWSEPNWKVLGREGVILLGTNFSLKLLTFSCLYSAIHFGIDLQLGLSKIGLDWLVEKIPGDLQELGLAFALVEILRPVRYAILMAIFPFIRKKALKLKWFQQNKK